MMETKNSGVYMEKKGNRFRFYTENLNPGKRVYDERLYRDRGIEYREWSTTKSKVGAALAKNVCPLKLNKGDYILYLGVASGTTASHLSDIVGDKGLIFGLDVSSRVLRELYFLAHKRKNIIPILADCALPDTYTKKICKVDFLIQDISQKSQVGIFLKNLKFLKKGGRAFLSIKARSIDVTKQPRKIFEMVRRQLLEAKMNIIDYKTLDPLELDHCVFVIEK